MKKFSLFKGVKRFLIERTKSWRGKKARKSFFVPGALILEL